MGQHSSVKMWPFVSPHPWCEYALTSGKVLPWWRSRGKDGKVSARAASPRGGGRHETNWKCTKCSLLWKLAPLYEAGTGPVQIRRCHTERWWYRVPKVTLEVDYRRDRLGGCSTCLVAGLCVPERSTLAPNCYRVGNRDQKCSRTSSVYDVAEVQFRFSCPLTKDGSTLLWKCWFGKKYD